MKITYIIALVVIAAGVGIMVTSFSNASNYVSFNDAYSLAKDGNSSENHVVGELKKDAQGNVIGVEYNPTIDPNYLAFLLVDENKVERKVITTQPPAQMADFYRSEKVVVVGKFKGEQFIASEILMKCPSKYEEKEIKAKP